jgi:hypothetical protein
MNFFMDEQQQRRVNEAAEQFADAVRASFQAVSERGMASPTPKRWRPVQGEQGDPKTDLREVLFRNEDPMVGRRWPIRVGP